MARKMKKFSAGGAQGRYDRRMADIEKDYAKAAARKTGKAAEVAEAKRQQRIADAKDDLAKRTGADRTATRAAEKAAEGNLTKTRKYGAAQSVTKDTAGPTGKITDTLGALAAPKSGLATAAKKPVQKPVQKPVDTPVKQDKAKLGASNLPSDQGFSRKSKVLGASKDLKTNRSGATGTGAPATGGTALRGRPMTGGLFSNIFKTSDAFKKAQEAKYGKAGGGTVKKETTMNKKPMPMKKKPMPKEPVTGGADTVPLTPGRKEFLKELAKRNAKPGMAKGGKATKFGAAMVKKSADTKGRAMVKKAGGGKCYAKGGSIDGIAVKGKTKTSMVKMARGGAAQMRSRDSYGGANFKKGGSC
jgi:hypothetical protein